MSWEYDEAMTAKQWDIGGVWARAAYGLDDTPPLFIRLAHARSSWPLRNLFSKM